MSETHSIWWEAVRQLPATHRFVSHEPETPRYARARQKLRYVVRTGDYLGTSNSEGDRGQIELAVWAPPEQGRGSGYYCCFRLFIEQGMVTGVVLFCFYDGTESSPTLKPSPRRTDSRRKSRMTKTKVKRKYPYQAAGRTWTVPELHLTSLPDGSATISEAEIERIHRAIANEICGDDASLTMSELEFLCALTGTTFTDVANALQIHRSTVTRWRKSGQVPKSVMSLVLKKWFWNLLFGESLGAESVPLECAVDETRFLAFLRRETIERHLADPVSQAKMSVL